MEVAAAAVLGYLLGSVPFGVLVGKAARGVDVREYGSGKTGFTNSLRVLGLRRSLLVFLGDFGKGVLAALLPLLFSDGAWAPAVGGLMAVAGHVWPVFAGFRGGRGVLTGAGALIALNPLALLVILPACLLAALVTRIMSVVSLAGATSGAVAFVVLAAFDVHSWAYAAVAVIGVGLIVFMHRENIQRLRAGAEPRIGQGGGRRMAM
jgi:glycerol-3-phosphate acyltransferase PlsY